MVPDEVENQEVTVLARQLGGIQESNLGPLHEPNGRTKRLATYAFVGI